MAQEGPRELCVPMGHCHAQRGLTTAIPRIRICPMLKQCPRDFGVPIGRGRAQGGVTCRVASVHIHPFGQEYGRGLGPVHRSREV